MPNHAQHLVDTTRAQRALEHDLEQLADRLSRLAGTVEACRIRLDEIEDYLTKTTTKGRARKGHNILAQLGLH